MPITFDPNDIPDTDDIDYPVLAIGEYDCIVAAAEEKTSSNGNEMIVLTLDIDHDGRTWKVWHNLTFTAKAMGIVKAACDALGLGDELRSGELSAEQFVGAMGRVKIKHETYQGEVRAKVGYFIAGTAKPKPAPASPIAEEDIPF